MQRRHLVLAVLGAVLGLVIVIIYMVTRPYVLHGSVIEPLQAAPALALTADSGDPFDLSQQQGRIVILFFGYTSCPDVCPATLSQMRQVMTGLGQNAAAVQVVLVTVDPKRDTPEALKRYVTVFGEGFMGLSGSQEQLEKVWQAYGVYRAIRPVGDNPDTYTVDHTARLYLIDKAGRLRLTYPYGTDVDDILKDVKYLLKEG